MVDIFKKINIVVLGSRSVGKSSLVTQFIEKEFYESYHPTIERTFSKSISFKDVEYDCDIIDTAGHDEYSILNPRYVIGIHGFVLVYSVTSLDSFDMVQIIYDKVINFHGIKEIPCVIVGVKTDLKQRRQVNPEKGQELADERHAAWVEANVKDNINVAKVFETCLAEIERSSPRRKNEPPASHCSIQ